MKIIVFSVGIMTIFVLVVLYLNTRSIGNTSINTRMQYNQESPQIVSGEILVTLKPYAHTNVLDEYIKKYPELSKIENSVSLPSFSTLSLKPYSEWQKKVSPSQKDDPKVKQEILLGEAKLQEIHTKIKIHPILSDSNIWNSFYSSIKPEENYFAVIHVFFKKGVSQKERQEFFGQYPELEIIKDYEESKTFTIKTPQGKEQYWLSEFLKQEFIKAAAVNEKGRLTQ